MLRGLDVLISCCVAVAVGDLGSDLDSELCQSDDCAAKQARTGLAAANDDDLQDPNTIAVKFTNHLPKNVGVFWLSTRTERKQKLGLPRATAAFSRQDLSTRTHGLSVRNPAPKQW